ncbi:ubiquitin-associated protein 2 [Plakobranchus ocellatus]|uniref:Ubiquitin-associated protein 2 n=1 Tax=Plakobranchus ocellatus TaxID=259542 RepID=A0AAV4ARW6_9GAST|nr:ubiquitin-associated protein 2 [Plakobranchus ocellatus]
MSGSVSTTRAGSNKHSGNKDKMAKSDKSTQQQQATVKSDSQLSKMQPTQEQIRLAQMMSTNERDADPSTVRELMQLTGKSEEDVVIALHDTENDADQAVIILLNLGDEQQGEWREQGGKRKKKSNTSTLKDSNHTNEDHFESRPKDRGDREDRDSGADRGDLPPRRGGRRNGGPPPRLARGRGRDRGNVGDRENRDRSNTEDWDNDRGDDKKDRGGADRGRSRGKGGFGGRRPGGGGRGRFANSSDREGNRSFNRVPRFEKMNNSQLNDGPEIDTWTNETAETKAISKDTDWDNWNDSWVNEEDQWTGTLDETKVFTPSTMKLPEAEPVIPEPPSSLGQRLDVGSLFIESAKFSKAPDYSKPSGDAYITQFNQAATESIKNTIGIGSSTRGPQSLNPLSMSQQSTSDSLGLSSLAPQSSSSGVGVLSSLPQPGPQTGMTQMSQISQSVSQAMSQIGMGSQQNLPPQSRVPSVQQQQQQQQQSMGAAVSLSSSLQQRPKPQKSKLPPPSKIPASAVEMPGHIARNPQLDLQFGIDFGGESSTSFGFGADSDTAAVTSTYATTSNGTSSVISNHLNSAHAVSKASGDNTIVSGLMSSPSAGSSNVPSPIELQQGNRQPSVFHNSVYTASPPKNDSQALDRDQSKVAGPESITFPSQMERKSPMISQRASQPNQNLTSASLAQNKGDGSSTFPSTNGYSSSSYQSHQKTSSISHNQSTFNHSSSSQAPQSSPFPGQYPASQSAFPSSGQSQFGGNPGSSQFPPPPGQPPQFNNAQNQYSSSGQSQFSSTGSSNHPSMPHSNHQSQYPSGPQNSYSTGGQSHYSGYQNNSSSSFPSHPSSSNSYPSSNQSSGPSSSLYPVTTQSGSSNSSYTAQSNSYQSPSAGSYNSRDNQTGSNSSNTGVNFSTPPQGLSLKPSTSQTNTNYNSQSFSANPAPLQPSSLANKLGESLSKMTLKDTATLDGHGSSQFDHSNTSTASVSAALSLPSTTTVASLSSGTSTISSTATSITTTSRITTMPSTSKAPPNMPPGVPVMGQYIMSQNTMPPFYNVPPFYGYEDMQLLQQRMPLQTGSYYDMSAFPAPPGSTLPAGRDQQPPLPNVPFSGTSADTSKVPRVDAQSPNSSSQPQNAHSAAQPLFNFHYGYYYPSMFPGTAGLQYPMFPMPPVTNAPAHAGTTATTQFQKSYASHVYTTKGYDELNQAQDFSKTGYGSSPNSGKASGTRAGTSDITPNAYNKPHSQPFDKQGFHGGTPPPYNLPLANATQSGPMGGPTNPYGAGPFLPVMAAHQAHSQMMHHPMQQDSGSSSSRGLNQSGGQSKAGGGKSYGGAPTYWNN